MQEYEQEDAVRLRLLPPRSQRTLAPLKGDEEFGSSLSW
jgi:hypothetical protein